MWRERRPSGWMLHCMPYNIESRLDVYPSYLFTCLVDDKGNNPRICLVGIELSASQVLKAKVSCVDCTPNYDLSGIKVVVKCANIKKLATTTTKGEGSFEVELPSGKGNSETEAPLNCLAKIIGGTSQMYATRKNVVSRVVRAQDSSSYTISTPLAIFSTQPNNVQGGIGESKTIDLPLPREWGLAPSSYYVPFFPIIGIP